MAEVYKAFIAKMEDHVTEEFGRLWKTLLACMSSFFGWQLL